MNTRNKIYPFLSLSVALAVAGCGGAKKPAAVAEEKSVTQSSETAVAPSLTVEDLEAARAAVILALDTRDGAEGLFELSTEGGSGVKTAANGKRLMAPMTALGHLPLLSISRTHVTDVLNALLKNSASRQTDLVKKRSEVELAFNAAIAMRSEAILKMHRRFINQKVDGISGNVLSMELNRLAEMASLLADSDGMIESTVSEWVAEGKNAASVDLDSGTIDYESSGVTCVKNFMKCGADIVNILERSVTTGKGNQYATAAVFSVVNIAKKLSDDNIKVALAVSNAYLTALDISTRRNGPSLAGKGWSCAIYFALDPVKEPNSIVWNSSYENCMNEINRAYAKMHAVTSNAIIWTTSPVSKAVTGKFNSFMCSGCKPVIANNATILKKSKDLDAANTKAFDATTKKIMDLRSSYIKANPSSLLVVGGEQAALRAEQMEQAEPLATEASAAEAQE